MTDNGVISLRSGFAPAQTMDRLVAAVNSRGMTVFARIDHAAGAHQVGLTLRPTELLIFGNARGGTPLMQATQTIGLDLPIRALVWQDDAAVTWLSYNDPAWLARRHGAQGAPSAAVAAMSHALEGLAREVTTAGA